MKRLAISALLTVTALMVQGAGFGLYETSAAANQNGGHRVGKAIDASGVYYNPATISGMTGTVATVGCTMIHPTLDTEVNGKNTHMMNPGYFWSPCAFVTQELPWDFTAGVGFYADFGLGSKYLNTWPLAFNSYETTVKGYCLSPTLSYKITERWNVAAGLRFEHVDFEQKRIYRFDELAHYAYGPSYLGNMKMRLKADNDVAVGYLVGSTYELFDGFYLGGVWRSRIRCDMEGHSSCSGDTAYSKQVAQASSKHVEEDLDLPMSATVGFNWDKAWWIEKLHMGATVTWTEWSTLDTLNFGLSESFNLGWHNAYRTGFGFDYDLTDWFTPGVGYIYDWDPTDEDRPSTMLPAGDRHNIYFGGIFHITQNLDFAIGAGIVIMESKTAFFDNPVTKEKDAFEFKQRNSHTYLGYASITYHF